MVSFPFVSLLLSSYCLNYGITFRGTSISGGLKLHKQRTHGPGQHRTNMTKTSRALGSGGCAMIEECKQRCTLWIIAMNILSTFSPSPHAVALSYRTWSGPLSISWHGNMISAIVETLMPISTMGGGCNNEEALWTSNPLFLNKWSGG